MNAPLIDRQNSFQKSLSHRLPHSDVFLKITRIEVVEKNASYATFLASMRDIKILLSVLGKFRVKIFTKRLKSSLGYRMKMQCIFGVRKSHWSQVIPPSKPT